MFLNFKAVVTGHVDKAIVNEVEAGENHIKAKFEDAIVDRKFSSEVRALIKTSHALVKAGYDEMREIEHSMQN